MDKLIGHQNLIILYFVIACLFQDVPKYASELSPKEYLESKPLKGLRVGVIRETLGEGVDLTVASSVQGAVSHLEELGAAVREVYFYPAPSLLTHLFKIYLYFVICFLDLIQCPYDVF